MHVNEKLVRDLYDAMARGDGRALAQALTSETRWIIPGRGSTSGVYTGSDEIFGFWKRVAAETGGGLALALEDVLANDLRAVALVTVSGVRGERAFEGRQSAVFELADGKITSATFVYEDPQAYEEFWAT